VPSCHCYTWYVRPVEKSLMLQLHQPLAIDEKDSDGHTALMWAAYQGGWVCCVARPRLMAQGDAISVDLLLRHGASVATADNAGMTPLHWAAVKGSKACIKHIVAAGADLEAKEEQGKTAKDMAEELKGLAPFNKGLEEAGFSSLGTKRLGKLSEVSDSSGIADHGSSGSGIQQSHSSSCPRSSSSPSSIPLRTYLPTRAGPLPLPSSGRCRSYVGYPEPV
jgi:ankyrin repeat protein